MHRYSIWLLSLVAVLLSGLAANVANSQSLDGTWEITAVIDNGRVIDPSDVSMYYAVDGRVVVRGQQVELVVPMTFQRKQLPFIVDPTKSPMTFDLAGAERTGGRGIFMSSKDTLLLCLSSRDQNRPTSFASQPGSGNMLVTLRRATGGNSPLPTTPNIPSYQDEQLRRMLVGTWGHQDSDSIHYMTLNNDGTVNERMTWKDQFKQLFHQDVQSTGTWQVQDGVVTITIAQSTDKELRGQTGSFRVRSINGSELAAVDYNGQVRQEWKGP
jgi:uncharacterized protein (TIGR03067 family)